MKREDRASDLTLPLTEQINSISSKKFKTLETSKIVNFLQHTLSSALVKKMQRFCSNKQKTSASYTTVGVTEMGENACACERVGDREKV